MKRIVMSGVAVLGVGMFVAGAWAGCPGDCGKAKQAKAVTVREDGRSETAKTTPCSGHAGKAPCHAKGEKEPCGSHATVTTVADKAPCGSHAAAASDKAPCAKAKGAPCGSHAALTSAGGDAAVAEKVHAVLASMPAMKYKVGDDLTGCPKAAAAMASEHHQAIEYVVGDQSFKIEGDATAYLASLIEKKVDEMKSVQFATAGKCYGCPKTAAAEAKKAHAKLTYRVAGVDFDTKEQAHHAAMLAKEKLGEIKMSYKVGDKTFCCDKMAGAQAKETGKKMLYVIGDEETDCQYEAEMLMAKAKLMAIIAAATAVLAS